MHMVHNGSSIFDSGLIIREEDVFLIDYADPCIRIRVLQTKDSQEYNEVQYENSDDTPEATSRISAATLWHLVYEIFDFSILIYLTTPFNDP